MNWQSLLAKASNPRWLLLLDALGALATCLTIGLLFASGRIPTGLPATSLLTLSAIALLLFFVSILSFSSSRRPHLPLRCVAIANLAYCLLTSTLLIVYGNNLTIWACVYFPIEILIIVCLAAWEFTVSSRHSTKFHG